MLTYYLLIILEENMKLKTSDPLKKYTQKSKMFAKLFPYV